MEDGQPAELLRLRPQRSSSDELEGWTVLQAADLDSPRAGSSVQAVALLEEEADSDG